MKCRSCKREIPDNSIFCNWCGKRQVKEPAELRVPAPRRLPSGSWFIQMRIAGQSVSVTEKTEAACKAKARALKSGALAIKKNHRLTLGEAVDKYIDDRSRTLSPSTLRGYEAIRRTRFLPYMGKPVDGINFQRMVNDEAPLCSAKTLKNAWGLVRAALQAEGCAVSATTPAVPKADRPWLTPEEILRFVPLLQDQPCALPALLALHSLRRSEVFGLDWADIKLDAGRISVNGATVMDRAGELVTKDTGKTAASVRSVPILIPALHELLLSVPEAERVGPVVKGWINSPYYQINKLCERNGLPKVGMHGLRHSFASLGYHLGIKELEIMRLGGWSNYEVVHKIYTHLSALDLSASAQKMQEFYSSS